MTEKTSEAEADWWERLYADDEPPADTPAPATGGAGRIPDWRTGQHIDLGEDTSTEPDDDTDTEPDDAESEPDDDVSPADDDTDDTDTTPGNSAPRPPAPQRTPFDPNVLRISRIRRTCQRAVLLNTPAAATGAWGYGALTARWDIGIPQTVLAWMHDAATSSASPLTPLIIGGLVAVGAAVVSSAVYSRLAPLIAHVTALCAVAHWLLVRVPVASCTAALLLYSTS